MVPIPHTGAEEGHAVDRVLKGDARRGLHRVRAEGKARVARGQRRKPHTEEHRRPEEERLGARPGSRGARGRRKGRSRNGGHPDVAGSAEEESHLVEGLRGIFECD